MRPRLLASATSLALVLAAGCTVDADDDAGGDLVLESPAIGVVEQPLAAAQIVYVNFDGVTVADCDGYCSDAEANRSWAIGEVWKKSAVAFAPYGGGSAARADIFAKLSAAFAPYDVVLTMKRPASGPYTMVVISPTSGPHHGVAPLNCGNTNPSDIAFVYSIGASSPAWIAQAAAHELGHSFGLSHVTSGKDFMQWASSGTTFTVSSYDTAHPSGQCFTGSVQDAPAMLLANLGARGDSSPFVGTFADDDDSAHQAAIEKIYAAKITTGCGGTTARPRFCPKEDVTRGQMVVFLSRALKLPASSVNAFTDDDGAWFEAAADAASAAGITKGCGGTSFCGDRPVTRAEMASFLVRAFGYPTTTTDYFSDDAKSIHQAAINRLAAAGVTTGCGGGKYCPDAPVTREQMASFLARALGL